MSQKKKPRFRNEKDLVKYLKRVKAEEDARPAREEPITADLEMNASSLTFKVVVRRDGKEIQLGLRAKTWFLLRQWVMKTYKVGPEGFEAEVLQLPWSMSIANKNA